MRYPTDTFSFVEGQYPDYFNGAEYQKLSKSNAYQDSDLKVILALYVDIL
jgi:hypothetical protein